MIHVAKWLRSTKGPNGGAPSSTGFHRQYMSPRPVASCASASAESARPIALMPRTTSRTRPLSKILLLTMNTSTSPAAIPGAQVPAGRSRLSGMACGSGARRRRRATASVAGEKRSMSAAGSGNNWNAIATRITARHASSARPRHSMWVPAFEATRRVNGRYATVNATITTPGPISDGTYTPANANVVHASSRTRRRGPDCTRPALCRALGLTVVVLVLVAVIARVVVLVAVEVDAIEDDADAARTPGLKRFERTLRVHATRHFGAHHEHDPRDLRRDDDRVGDRENRRRVHDDPVEGTGREIRQEAVHAFRGQQLRRVRRYAARGDHDQVGLAGALHRFAHACLADEEVR